MSAPDQMDKGPETLGPSGSLPPADPIQPPCSRCGHSFADLRDFVAHHCPNPPADPTPPLTVATTPLPWHWDGLDLWHFGEGYDSPTDPHRFTGVVADPRLARSPILKMNMALIVEAVNAHATLTAALAERTAERDAMRKAVREWHEAMCEYREGDVRGSVDKVHRAEAALVATLAAPTEG